MTQALDRLSQIDGLTPVYGGQGGETANLQANGWRLPTEAELLLTKGNGGPTMCMVWTISPSTGLRMRQPQKPQMTMTALMSRDGRKRWASAYGRSKCLRST